MDGVSVSRNVQGSVDKNSGAPPWRDTGQWTEFPCPEMCRDLWIKTPVPLPGGIQANRRSFRVWKCAGVRGYTLRCPSLQGYGPTDGVSMSGNVQGSVDKNSGAPPWRDTGQWMEFPCPEMCRGLWIKTLVPLPGGIRANRWSFHVRKCAGTRGQKLGCPSLEGYAPTHAVALSGNVQGSVDKNSGAPPWRDTGQQTEFPCSEMCRDPWIKTPVPLPGGIWANGWSFHVWKCAGICG